ncbi:TIGR04282 family arsenosugar biosynthesis glycosyltransferase [Gilvibacter sediminis]|uniref:TIGR04282 family arsenosugar biosynthesis glycosyltransferase n=1 Tax=Gilvibacter sediminis TaxID=379071 RepID=UPI0023503A7B|nr:TIGR04282 family arsenosugar biosynthesis glycosyltransferase [Gilvibacter sediminis]MDC7997363.1 TIGR04282 family arsenosugar biosynthesis glycosyltransferase [Gilvibacter sediminis]
MTDSALIIFTRNPELGKCKTRLAATIGDQNALEVYQFLLDHTVSITRDLPFDKYVFYSEKVHNNDRWDENIYQKEVQSEGDLGLKMRSAFEQLFAKGYKKLAIIGSDLFDLQSKDLIDGLALLDQHEAVIGPAQDGGYYFLGMTHLIPEIFEKKEWGTDTVLMDTINDLLNKNFSSLPVRNDIDYFEDIKDKAEFQRFIPEHLQ